MQIRTLLFILLALAFSSCERDIYISIPNESNKPVINLLMNKDSVMMARVTLSSQLRDQPGIQEVKNAVVNLYENGSFKETLTPTLYKEYTLYYRSTTLPKAGASYKVTCAIPGFPEASGTDQIPDTVRIGEMKLNVLSTGNDMAKISYSIQIHDDPAVQNYYRIRIYDIIEWVDANGNPGYQKSQQYFEQAEANIPPFDEKSGSDFFTTDALFNGRSPTFVLKVNAYSNRYKKVVVEISSLTYHSYNYLYSAYLAREKNDDGFSEKVIVYNNIVNGLGIIGGVAQRDYELQK